MNKKLFFSVMLICLFAFMVVSVVSCTKAYAQSNSNVRWEYTTFVTRDYPEQNRESFIQSLNQLGAEGWELVLRENYSYIFKRRLP